MRALGDDAEYLKGTGCLRFRYKMPPEMLWVGDKNLICINKQQQITKVLFGLASFFCFWCWTWEG